MGIIREMASAGGIGWKELLKRSLKEIKDDDCMAFAAAAAYYLLFALFPFFLFLTALIAYLPVPNLLDLVMKGLSAAIPQEGLKLLEDNVRGVVTQRKGGILSFGVIVALWTSSTAVVALADGLNRVYDVKETRSFLRLRGTAMLLIVGLALFIGTSFTLLVFGPKIGETIAGVVGLGGAFTAVWNIVRWPVILALVALAISGVYYLAPNVKQNWKWVSPGSVVAVLLWLAASGGFSFYVNNFGSYNKTYGSIGAVIVLLTWLFISSLVILLGGEINSEIEKAAKGRDS